MSKAFDFIKAAWENNCADWQTHNQGVRQAAILAVKLFTWEPGELDRVFAIRNSRYSIDKSFGSTGREDLYAVAVMESNDSFCIEYERFVGRSPIIADNVDFVRCRQSSRLCVGSSFTWDNDEVKVTSFNAKGEAIAVSYEVISHGTECDKCGCCLSGDKTKIKKRYSISRDDVLADRKRRKAAETSAGR